MVYQLKNPTKYFLDGFCSLGNLYPKLEIPENLKNIEIPETDNSVESVWRDVGLAFDKVGIAMKGAINEFERR
jgi:hypothetical protein